MLPELAELARLAQQVVSFIARSSHLVCLTL
jgi:hypothetical protein